MTTPSPRFLARVAALMAAFVLALLAGCAGPGGPSARTGRELIAQGRTSDGLAELEKAVAAEPDNRSYRMELIRQREIALGSLLARGDALLADGQADAALASYRRADALAPGHPRARTGIETADARLRQDRRVDEAEALLAAGRPDEAGRLLAAVLADNPMHRRARALRQQTEPAPAGLPDRAGAALRSALRKPVTLDFREASLRNVFDALSRGTGINFVFDREVRNDARITVSIANVSIEDAIGTLCVANQLERKVLNENTVLIYPNTPAKQREHLELGVKTFYLSNTDAKTVVAMLKTVLKTKDLYADDKLNTLTMRDTADAIRLAEKLIAAQDQAEPEVTLDVEVLEVKRARLSELGLEPPGKFTVLNLVKNPDTVVSTATGATTVVNNTLTTTQLTLDKLRGLDRSSIGIDNPALNVRAENADTNILANPRIRVRNRDKARIHIGDRVPVITTTATPNVGVSESVNYLDVGLKLEVEPNVFLDNEVGVKVNLEVSSLVREVRSRTGTLTYQIGTRVAATSLRLRDGETQALAGLISDEDRTGTVGVPGLLNLPVLGRLFSSERSDRSKTEIVLLITPRVVRNIDPVAAARYEYASGTESAVGAAPVRLQGAGRIALPPSRGAARAAAAASGAPEEPQGPQGPDSATPPPTPTPDDPPTPPAPAGAAP